MSRPHPTPEEEREWALERAAVLQCALRHLAAAWHRTHASPRDPSWVQCQDHFCVMAHEAVENRYAARTRTPQGVVISLKKKEA